MWLKQKIGAIIVEVHNRLIDLFGPAPLSSSSAVLGEIFGRARTRTDISDHLVTLFVEAVNVRPKLIVELGVRGGESTFVLERAARLSGQATLVSVDIEDCSRVIQYENWHFVKSDDIAFAQAFPAWCKERGLSPEVDLLFIDTTHLFEHSLQEIQHWLPLVSAHGKAIFHDTNQRRIFWRRDGSIGIGWTNREVTAALEKYLDRRFSERRDFVEVLPGWLIVHHATCNGFTMLTRLPPSPVDRASAHVGVG